MKLIYKEKISEYTVYRRVADASIDPEATRKKVESMIKPEMSEAEINQLYFNNPVYAKVGPEAAFVNDSVGETVQNKLDALGENRLLLLNGEYLADYRGTEYWVKIDGVWLKEKIEAVGIELPEGAILQENLNDEHQAEIATQQEKERIAALTPEQTEKEKTDKLYALAREALMKKEEADLLGESFDAKAYVNSKKVSVEEVYAANSRAISGL